MRAMGKLSRCAKPSVTTLSLIRVCEYLGDILGGTSGMVGPGWMRIGDYTLRDFGNCIAEGVVRVAFWFVGF
jgi:hypothetical protein